MAEPQTRESRWRWSRAAVIGRSKNGAAFERQGVRKRENKMGLVLFYKVIFKIVKRYFYLFIFCSQQFEIVIFKSSFFFK
ncbi:Uncharacterized protein TCM_027426 [Theobroma cacao]|uniref:Uncharacterized protein n=1 Tax=Theobroma cacao TaxID=3641 RepID=A0A061G9D2_THECC|nr:Uncharacterized protein TCM_027426 [Theobroma cacao]